jgi:hypothetical protein
MSVTATPSEDKTNAPFRLNVAVTKVDKETRMVTGAATAEVVDKGGQIIDYATVKKFFQDKDLWPGNIRELENEMERVIVLSGDDPKLAAEDAKWWGCPMNHHRNLLIERVARDTGIIPRAQVIMYGVADMEKWLRICRHRVRGEVCREDPNYVPPIAPPPREKQ